MNTKRRDFLKSAGGIVVAFSWSVPPVLAQQPARPALPGSLGTNRMLNGWIRINPAGTVTVFTGKPSGGEDRKFVVDARTGAVLSSESYADKPLLYRLHSGEAFGDGGLVASMLWGVALAAITLTGLVMYLRILRARWASHADTKGVRRFFW